MKIEIKRSHRKTMSIIIRDGALLVRAPHFVSDEQIRNFVLSKEDWVQKKLAQYRPMGFDYQAKSMRVFGVEYPLNIVRGERFVVELDQNLTIIWPYKMSETRLKELVELHFKTILENVLSERVPYFAQQLHLKTPNFSVRRYKRLYGRCSKDHQLGFNTYLFHDRLDFIDYVVLHECAHMIEFNHSKRFYDLIAVIMPDYKAIIAANKSSDRPHQDQ